VAWRGIEEKARGSVRYRVRRSAMRIRRASRLCRCSRDGSKICQDVEARSSEWLGMELTPAIGARSLHNSLESNCGYNTFVMALIVLTLPHSMAKLSHLARLSDM